MRWAEADVDVASLFQMLLAKSSVDMSLNMIHGTCLLYLGVQMEEKIHLLPLWQVFHCSFASLFTLINAVVLQFTVSLQFSITIHVEQHIMLAVEQMSDKRKCLSKNRGTGRI